MWTTDTGSPGPSVLSHPNPAPDKGASAEKLSQIPGTEGGCGGGGGGGGSARPERIPLRVELGADWAQGVGTRVYRQPVTQGAGGGAWRSCPIWGHRGVTLQSDREGPQAVLSRRGGRNYIPGTLQSGPGRARSHLVDVNPRSPRALAPLRGAGTRLGPQCRVEDAWRARSGAARG